MKPKGITVALALAVTFALALSACGVKGALRHPDQAHEKRHKESKENVTAPAQPSSLNQAPVVTNNK